MEELFPVALHKAILGVDIEGFADRRRTNPDQILVREGLYRCLQEAFARAGIAWEKRAEIRSLVKRRTNTSANDEYALAA